MVFLCPFVFFGRKVCGGDVSCKAFFDFIFVLCGGAIVGALVESKYMEFGQYAGNCSGCCLVISSSILLEIDVKVMLVVGCVCLFVFGFRVCYVVLEGIRAIIAGMIAVGILRGGCSHHGVVLLFSFLLIHDVN